MSLDLYPRNHQPGGRKKSVVDARSYYLRARTMADMGLLEAARTDLQKAILMDPCFPDAHYYLGHVYQRLAQAEAAAQKFDQYVQLAPEADDVPFVQARVRALRADR